MDGNHVYLQRDTVYWDFQAKAQPGHVLWNTYQVCGTSWYGAHVTKCSDDWQPIIEWTKASTGSPRSTVEQSNKVNTIERKVRIDSYIGWIMFCVVSRKFWQSCLGEVSMVVSRIVRKGEGPNKSNEMLMIWPGKLGKIPILTNIFQTGGWNHQLEAWIFGELLDPCFFKTHRKNAPIFWANTEIARFFFKKCLVPYGWPYKCYNIVSSCQSLTLRSK